MQPDEPNDEERQEELPGDGQTPFSIPKDRRVKIGDDQASLTRPLLDTTHPSTDTGIEREELYDEGVSGAAEAGEPNAGDDVISYDPGEHKRKAM